MKACFLGENERTKQKRSIFINEVEVFFAFLYEYLKKNSSIKVIYSHYSAKAPVNAPAAPPAPKTTPAAPPTPKLTPAAPPAPKSTPAPPAFNKPTNVVVPNNKANESSYKYAHQICIFLKCCLIVVVVHCSLTIRIRNNFTSSITS